jgi:hypothetical protein
MELPKQGMGGVGNINMRAEPRGKGKLACETASEPLRFPLELSSYVYAFDILDLGHNLDMRP